MNDPTLIDHFADVEIEARVLGCILFDPRLMVVAANAVTSEDFWRPAHRWIWRAMLEVFDDGIDVDAVLIADWLRSQPHKSRDESLLDTCGGAAGIARLSLAVGSSAVFEPSVKALGERLARRTLRDTMHTAAMQLADGHDTADVVAGLNRNVHRLTTGGLSNDEATHASTIAREVLADIEAGTPMLTRFATGTPPIDIVLDGGFAAGMHYIVGALSGHGKTTIASSMIAGLLAQNPTMCVDWYGCEVPAKWQFCRIASAQAGVPESFWRQAKADSHGELFKRAMVALDWGIDLDSRLRIFHCAGGINVRDVALKTAVRRRVLGDRPLVVVVDYIQRAHAGVTSGQNKSERVAGASEMFAGLADEHTITIAMSQFTETPSDNEPTPMPKPTMARWAKDIHHDACDWLTYHRPRVESAPPMAVLQLAKSRYGRLGHAWLLGSPSNRFGSLHSPGTEIRRMVDRLYPRANLAIPHNLQGLQTTELRP